MKTFEIIASANETIKTVATNMREGNRVYNSISQVLKDIQRKNLLKAGYQQVFDKLGLEAGKVTPKDFFASLDSEQWGRTVSKDGKPIGDKWVGIWGTTQKKDADGNKVFEADGVTPVMEAKLRKVTAWTPTKLFKVYAQCLAIKAAKA